MSEEFVVVFESNNQVEAILYQNMLQDAGIQVMDQPQVDPFLTNVIVTIVPPEYRLFVRAEDAQKARELVDAYRAEVERGDLSVNGEEAGE